MAYLRISLLTKHLTITDKISHAAKKAVSCRNFYCAIQIKVKKLQ